MIVATRLNDAPFLMGHSGYMRNQERIKEQGKRLRAERLSRGITQEAIAEVMDVSERQYRRMNQEKVYFHWKF